MWIGSRNGTSPRTGQVFHSSVSLVSASSPVFCLATGFLSETEAHLCETLVNINDKSTQKETAITSSWQPIGFHFHMLFLLIQGFCCSIIPKKGTSYNKIMRMSKGQESKRQGSKRLETKTQETKTAARRISTGQPFHEPLRSYTFTL
ncbi:MAG: hypothetical protein QM683_13170 [Lacrimispora sp.]